MTLEAGEELAIADLIDQGGQYLVRQLAFDEEDVSQFVQEQLALSCDLGHRAYLHSSSELSHLPGKDTAESPSANWLGKASSSELEHRERVPGDMKRDVVNSLRSSGRAGRRAVGKG
jgi:hypothetical protein